ncbi:hypothetical protein [Laspinema palackyanum]|uniref:hypothetical protein n=1 Tax=Laspinema palackyanum TaxID=3231601 RepID=UPI00345D8F52|nr:hypothetical protein [Laspinema sp. D2c]
MVQSPNYFSKRKLTLLDKIPEPLKALLNKINQEHYEELYEPEADGRVSLEDALNEVLEFFHERDKTYCQIRYVWMTLIFAVLVEPTVEYYNPENGFTKQTIHLIEKWILSNIIDPLARSRVVNYQFQAEKLKKLEYFLSKKINSSKWDKMASLQVIYEAIDVFKNSIRVLDYHQSKAALLEILEDCLEGYAIFPGSYGRRDLFDWWLLEVVPCSWHLVPPTSLYIVQGVENKDKIQLGQSSKLEYLSEKIRLALIIENGNQQNTFHKFNNKIEGMEISFNSSIPSNELPNSMIPSEYKSSSIL